MLIKNTRIVASSQTIPSGWLEVNEGKITAIGSGRPDTSSSQVIDGQGMTLLPGFIDLHVHGGIGYETMDAEADCLHELAAFYAQHGVTAFLPTTWTATHEQILAALRTIQPLVDQPLDGATILGAHAEGPYLNPEKCGAQDVRQIRQARPEEANELLDTGIIRLLALAPEFEANHWLIKACIQRGITVSAAHTSATYSDLELAVRFGLSQTTHTFNAMTGLHHREPGTVGAALTMPELRCEIITDGIHVHPAVVKLLYLAKGVARTMIVTDAVRGTGLEEGSRYEQDGREVVIRDGSAYLADGTLAGSTLTIDRAVRNFMAFTGTQVQDVWPVFSLNAARAIHVDDRKGSLQVGKDADCILVDQDMSIIMTIVEGRIAYNAL
jgi:N-acetylglucosamine-6-phosphate deacetylase